MKKIIVPDLSKFCTAAAFFTELIAVNKKRNAKFSHRYFAMHAKWPISYVSDLMKGRKRFTVARALDFAKLTNLNLLETEKIIYLSLSDSSNDSVKGYFEDRLKNRTTSRNDFFTKTTIHDKELFQNIEVGAVFEVLSWARRPLTALQIKKLLYTFPDLSVEKIDAIISMLKEKKAVEIKGNKLKILQAQLVLDQFNDGTDGGLKIHKDYALNFARYTEKPVLPGLFTSGFVEIPQDQFRETAKKLLEIRNWLLQYSAENNAAKKETLGSSLVYQFDINLILILEKKLIDSL